MRSIKKALVFFLVLVLMVPGISVLSFANEAPEVVLEEVTEGAVVSEEEGTEEEGTEEEGTEEEGTEEEGTEEEGTEEEGTEEEGTEEGTEEEGTETENTVVFNDIDGHWAKEIIIEMASKDIIKGMGNGRFEPDRNITRAEFATIVLNSLGLELQSGEMPFGDVVEGSWYYDIIASAYHYEIVLGYGDVFKPNQTITREEAFTIIANAAKLSGVDTEVDTEVKEIQLNKFTDKNKVSTWAEGTVAFCLENEIVVGYNSLLRPTDNITRAESATIAKRLLDLLEAVEEEITEEEVTEEEVTEEEVTEEEVTEEEVTEEEVTEEETTEEV